MTGKEILTEYFEDAVEQPHLGEEGEEMHVLHIPDELDHEVVEIAPEPPLVVSFSEDDFEMVDSEALLGGVDEEISFEEGLGELEDLELPGTADEELSAKPSGKMLPGASEPIFEEEPQEEEADDEEIETNWADDGDTSKFMDFLRSAFDSIPSHSGNSISGCERALAYLNKLNREISKAIRTDENNSLDGHLDEVEDYRVKTLQGMVALKKRIGDLKRKVKEEGSQMSSLASEDIETMIKESINNEELVKEAKSGKLQVVITPFERAITGILINSVVSAGHPFEDVYDYLKKKFDITEREELAILQIVMDMGFPIFKDRGTIGESGDGEREGHGVDFIKTYFA